MAIKRTEVGKRIKKLRKENNVTQERLAEKLGVSRNFISQLECGHNGISVEHLAAIAECLECSIDYLVTGRVSEAGNAGDLNSFQCCSDKEKEIILRSMEELHKILKDYKIQ